MGWITKLAGIVEEGQKEYLDLLWQEDVPRFYPLEAIGEEPENRLIEGDNLALLQELLKNGEGEGSIDLIYIDPPFFSRSNYGTKIKLRGASGEPIPEMRQKAYDDMWGKDMGSYLRMMIPRLYFMRDLLSDTGSIFVHLDWHASHGMKLVLDEIFGEKNFVNEIIWTYKSGGVSKRHFARKHDTILFYSKTKKYYFTPQKEKSYNRGLRPYRFKGVKEFRDEVGWYTLVNRKDVWQMDMVGRTAAERTGYVTQKPEALIERILESCTREGDLCADFFGGSGTMAAAADRMGRRWISCDIGALAILNSYKRLYGNKASFYLMEEEGEKKEGTGGKIEVRVEEKRLPIGDKDLLVVELEGYENEAVLEAPVEDPHRETLREIMEKDSLQLVDYWSVDWAYDGVLFRPDVCYCKEKDRIETRCELLGTSFGPVAVKVVDIFGNSGFSIVEPVTVEGEV